MKSKTLNVFIDCSPRKIYSFVRNLKNLSLWATMFCKSIRKTKGRWIAKTPQGPAEFRMAPKNNFGILDHYVIPLPNFTVYVPMRVVSNGKGSEVIFTLFQYPGMTDKSFKKNQALVAEDLSTLKKVMERF